MTTILPPLSERTIVMDASVIAKYMLPDESADEVRRMVPKGADQIAPSIIEFEIRSLLCKHVRLGRLTKEMADEALASWESALEEEWIWIVPMEEYINDAFNLGCAIKHPLYDCCYLALAQQSNASLVTADRKLYERGKAAYADILFAA